MVVKWIYGKEGCDMSIMLGYIFHEFYNTIESLLIAIKKLFSEFKNLL